VKTCAECGRQVVPAGDELTDRELEVLRQLATGYSNRAIGSMMGLAPKTVKNYTTIIFSKLDVHSRTEAVMKGLRMGLISLEVDSE
jgi:DNA-binding NarL/FixJ family response regulator